MSRLGLRSKLITAFLVVLLPMLGLIIYDYHVGYWQLSEETIDDQLRTGEAIAALADVSIDDAFSIAWSFAKDPVVQTGDPRQIDPYLETFRSTLPQLDDIAIFDLQGNNVGSMALDLGPDDPRPNAADRSYFRNVKATGQPAVDRIVISRATGNPVVVVAVPVFDRSGATIEGVAIAALNLEYLAQRVATVGLQRSQVIFMADPEGTIAFHTGLPHEQWGRLSFADYRPVQSAMRGAPGREREIRSPQGDVRIVATLRTAQHGWVVGVSVPRDEALQTIQADLVRRLLLFSAVLAFAGLVAVLLSRHVILHPLEVLMGHLFAFGRGQLERRVELRTGDEMELMAHTFNQMADQLEESSREKERLLEEAVQARLQLEETRRRREEFISMVAHDFRGPLAVMVGYGDMVAQAMDHGREVEPRVAEKIVGQAKRLRRLVEDLSDVSLIEAGRFKVLCTRCDLHKAAHDVIEQQQMMTRKHRIVLDAPPRPLVGEWDCDRLAQALNNLVNNAVKYSPGGGEVRVQLAETDREVVVSVSDQGIGIAPEDIPHLFQPYSRLDEERPIRGTGLGLYITRAVVEAHGGRFWVDSAEGAGSTFSFALPYLRPI